MRPYELTNPPFWEGGNPYSSFPNFSYVKTAAVIGYAYRHARRHLRCRYGPVPHKERTILTPLINSLLHLGSRIRPSEYDDLQMNLSRAPPSAMSLMELLAPIAQRSKPQSCSPEWDLPPPTAIRVDWPVAISLDELIENIPARSTTVAASLTNTCSYGLFGYGSKFSEISGRYCELSQQITEIREWFETLSGESACESPPKADAFIFQAPSASARSTSVGATPTPYDDVFVFTATDSTARDDRRPSSPRRDLRSYVSSPAIAADDNLPPFWARYVSASGEVYFHNSFSGKTQWEQPSYDYSAQVDQYRRRVRVRRRPDRSQQPLEKSEPPYLPLKPICEFNADDLFADSGDDYEHLRVPSSTPLPSFPFPPRSPPSPPLPDNPERFRESQERFEREDLEILENLKEELKRYESLLARGRELQPDDSDLISHLQAEVYKRRDGLYRFADSRGQWPPALPFQTLRKPVGSGGSAPHAAYLTTASSSASSVPPPPCLASSSASSSRPRWHLKRSHNRAEKRRLKKERHEEIVKGALALEKTTLRETAYGPEAIHRLFLATLASHSSSDDED